MSNKTRWSVLGLPNNIREKDVELGTFDTKKAALTTMVEEKSKYQQFGLQKRVGETFFFLVDQWNYYFKDGALYSHRNHHDLW